MLRETVGLGPLEELLRRPRRRGGARQRARGGLGRAPRQPRARPPSASTTRRRCATSSSGSSGRSAAGSTSSARWRTAGWPTGRGSTWSSRRSRSTARRVSIRRFAGIRPDPDELVGAGQLRRRASRAARRGGGGRGADPDHQRRHRVGQDDRSSTRSRRFIAPDERVITIEDAAELRLGQPHVVRLESRPAGIEGTGEVTIRDLVRNALRMRPDRIVIGEVRGRRGDGSARGAQHRASWRALDRARERARRRAAAARDAGDDGRPRRARTRSSASSSPTRSSSSSISSATGPSGMPSSSAR